MNTILENLKAGQTLDCGTFTIYAWDEGRAMTVRMNSSLQGPSVSITKTGLKRLLAWADAERKI